MCDTCLRAEGSQMNVGLPSIPEKEENISLCFMENIKIPSTYV